MDLTHMRSARLLTGFAAILFLFSLAQATAEEPAAIRIGGVDAGAAQKLEDEGLDVTFRGDGFIEALARQADLEHLENLGYSWLPLGRDLFPGARAGSREGNLDPEYHTYQETLDELQMLADTYPDICRIYDIGDALSKDYDWSNYFHDYDIWAVRISDNPNMDEPEPCIVYDARHHAREPVTTELVLAVANYFCENYGELPEVTQMVDGSEIWCVTMVNPDGHQWVEDHDPWWRKTLFDYNQNHVVDNDEGIDPNRNYDWHWDPGIWSSQTYGGPFPWSAPEVVAMRDLHNAQRTAINPSYHSYGEVVLYPFGYGVAAEPAVLEVVGEYANAIGYYSQQSTTANGSSKDWIYGTIGGCSFTVETATEFIPSGYTMLQIVQQVLPGSIWLTERLWGPSIQGTVTDSIAGIPLEATIHIPEIMGVYGNGELWDMMTEASTGYFCRMSPAAMQTITLEVSAEGYHEKILQVQTGGASATVVDIELVPENFDHGILTGVVTNITAGGTAIPGAVIELDGEPAFQTGPSGSYTGYVLPGTYTVTATHPSFESQSMPDVVIEIGLITEADFALVDIAGPEISGTTRYPNTSDTLGPYVIETQISDMSALGDLGLFYSIAGGSFVEVPLSSTGGHGFEAQIPGQPYTTHIRYYIRAVDEGDNASSDPEGAPDECYSFFVAPVVAIFADALEEGAAGWSHYVVSGGYVDQWHLSTQQNHTPSGSWSWKCGDTGAGNYANLLDAGLETPGFTLVDNSRLTCWHWIDAETSSSYPGQAYDGGIVEISIDGGPWEQIMPVGGYSHTCRTGGTPGPFPAGTPLFSGTHDWEEIEFDLSAYAGEARIRFRFGSDGAAGGTGWFIDDIEVSGLAIPSAVAEEDRATNSALLCTRFRCSPSVLSGTAPARIAYSLTGPAALHLRIFDAEGRQVRSILAASAAQHGVLEWNGRNAQGRPAGSGLYLMRLDAGRQQLARGKVVVLDR